MPRDTALHQEADVESAERLYSAGADAAHRKSLGQYFTPARVASLMADWIGQIEPKTILDPAMGTGVLVRAARERCPSAGIVAIEKDPNILAFADIGAPLNTWVCLGDFMRSAYDEKYDGVIMNPPYVRHREITKYDDVRDELSTKSGYHIPKSANLYVYFTIKAALQLRPGGRAAVLIPSEWMNANFAGTFKEFLLDSRLLKEVVLFSACSSLFDDVMTTASVLFLEHSR